MDDQGPIAASDIIESLTSWWELAGVDTAVGETPVDWLALDAKPEQTDAPETVRQELRQTQPPIAPASTAEWPQNIDDLRAMILAGAALPGNRFSSRYVAPTGPPISDVMIISDLPDGDEVSGGKLGDGASGQLLARMLAAIGINLSDCYWTALATTIPAAGELPDSELATLADFARHQMALVKPKHVILLGSSACRALLGGELMESRGRLGNINYKGGNMAALTTFHPRTLIARPQMKAQAWKDLQMFAKRADL
jgi:uracil-DNA glycosylase